MDSDLSIRHTELTTNTCKTELNDGHYILANKIHYKPFRRSNWQCALAIPFGPLKQRLQDDSWNITKAESAIGQPNEIVGTPGLGSIPHK